jgi:polyisoprenyl-phosphate glycosyltransferase
LAQAITWIFLNPAMSDASGLFASTPPHPRPVRTVTLLAPCYNEEAVLPAYYERVRALAAKHADHSFYFLFINDGSSDSTPLLLDALAKQDARVQVIHLAANRGHQIALTAGLDVAESDLVVIIDADLQDPPEVVTTMLERAEAGYDVINAQRQKRDGETWFKRASAALFYRIMRRLATRAWLEDCGDFRGLSHRAVLAMRSYREPHRFMRALALELGFRQCVITYNRAPRAAGETKYPLRKMVKLAVDAALGFSTAPIRAIIWLSLLLWCVSLPYLAWALYDKFIRHHTVPGWASIIMLVVFFSGLQLFCLGIIGQYVARIFEQGQRRPLYTVMETRNLPAPPKN